MGGQQKKIGQRARNEIMGFTASHKPAGLDLMQNCDLPPPSKVFVGPDKAVMLSMIRVCNITNMAGKEEQKSTNFGIYGVENGYDGESDKMELLKALQASQTRAREAERRAAILRKEKEGLSMVLLEEAMQLFAYRQQVKLLELQISKLQSLWLLQQQHHHQAKGGVGSSSAEDGSATWVLALALTLGIGVTTALACRYLL